MSYITYIANTLTCLFLGMLSGIVLRHYFDDSIPFDSIFERIEKFIYCCINFLCKLKENRFVRFVGGIIKNCLFTIFNTIKKLGNLIYKNRVAIGKTALYCANEIQKNYNGTDLEEFRTNNALKFSTEDIETIIKRITGHPYDTPSFVYCYPGDGVAWYDFQALRIVKQYEDLDRKSRIRMLELILQKYITETRGMNAAIYITMATSTRFYFGVALSKHGEKQLAKMLQNKETLLVKDTASLLEEEIIDLFPQENGEKS